MTAISQKARPPQKKSASGAVAWFIITGFLGLIWHWWLIATALALVTMFSVADYNKKKWPPLFAAWDRQYMCGRCGAIMVPALQAPKLVEAAPQSVETIQYEQLPPN